MRGMTGDLVGLVPPPEEPDPTVEPLRGVLGAGAGAFDPVAPLADSLRAAASVAVWGSTDNGDLCLWVVPADGEDGFVLVIGSRFEDWYEYGVSITEFLHRILTGDIRCPAFPEDFPTTGGQMVFGDVVAVANLPTARHSFLTGDQYIRVMDAWPHPGRPSRRNEIGGTGPTAEHRRLFRPGLYHRRWRCGAEVRRAAHRWVPLPGGAGEGGGASPHHLGSAPGGVVSVMSPQVALRQVGSRESSAGGFRLAGLALRKSDPPRPGRVREIAARVREHVT